MQALLKSKIAQIENSEGKLRSQSDSQFSRSDNKGSDQRNEATCAKYTQQCRIAKRRESQTIKQQIRSIGTCPFLVTTLHCQVTRNSKCQYGEGEGPSPIS
jgi:hypothetical protein